MSGPAAAVLGVLDELLTLLTDDVSGCAVVPPPCRSGLVPGAQVAWDTCGHSTCQGRDGQLWANLNTFSVVGSGGCESITWVATVGIVRCAATVKDDGQPPSVEALLADALQQAADSIRAAVDCCAGRSDAIKDITLVSWTALGPSGGCAGGQWTIKGLLDVCC